MKHISAQELEELLAEQKPVNIIDVRQPSEVATGKIPTAINIPLNLLEYRMNELNKNSEYIIVCHSGARSQVATQFLESYGYTAINMFGGMLAWEGITE